MLEMSVLCISLSPFLLGHPLFLSYSSCLFSTSSCSVSPLTLPPFFVNAFPDALQGCKVTKDVSRVCTHLANTEESSLLPVHFSRCPGLCRYTCLRGGGTKVRLGGGGRGEQVTEVSEGRGESEPAWARIKGRIQIYVRVEHKKCEEASYIHFCFNVTGKY